MKKLSKLMALLLALVLLMSIAAPAIAVEEKREDISSQEYSELLNAALQSSSTYAEQNVTLAFVDESGSPIQTTNSTRYSIDSRYSSVSCATIAEARSIDGYEYDYAYIYGDLGYLTFTITELRLKNNKIQYRGTWDWYDLNDRTVYLVYKKTEVTPTPTPTSTPEPSPTPTDDKVRVYVYVSSKDSNGNSWRYNEEFQELIGLYVCDENGYFPAGEITLDASYFTGKEAAMNTPGEALINNSGDWNKLIAALGDMDTSTIEGTTGVNWPAGENFNRNKGNSVDEYLSQASQDLNSSWGTGKSALFRWHTNSSGTQSSYGFTDQSVQYHLDLCFNLNTITFITGKNGITSGVAQDGTMVDTRAYITGSLIQEPRNLNIPAGYQFVGYYTDANFTTRWNGIGTPLNEDITVYIKITPLDNVIIYYKVAGNEGGTVSPDSEGLNPVTGIAQGSTATASQYYDFDGWYSDEACTTKVSSNAKYVPLKPTDGEWVSTTYYAKFEEKTATINYEVVGDGGAVTPTSETLNVLSGTASGSTPTANTNYHFVGWYTDAACTTPVTEDWVNKDNNNKLTPVKANGTAWTNTTYYAKFAEDQVTIKYEVVGDSGCGTVTLGSETVNVISGPVQGSTATANTGYTFKGWYTDAACGTPVDTTWVDGNKLTPQKNANGVYEAATYYAKFEENEVTINYVAVGPEGLNENGTPKDTAAGTVNPGSETLKVLSGTAQGSTPTANTNYHFVGWYTDASCDESSAVNASWVDSTTKHLTPVKDADDAWTNTTYYAKFEEDLATINYVAVGPEGYEADGTPKTTVAGSVNPGSETLEVISGEAGGSTATASSTTYKFVGWYTDAACTESSAVNPSWVDANNKLTPKKNDDAVWVDGTTYYAKFEYNLTTLTITKSGLTQTSREDCESAIFRVTDASGNLVARVALQNGSVTIDGLTVGQTYTITEENGWTWRYNDKQPVSVIIAPPADGANRVTISNTPSNNKWLGGDNKALNVFGTGSNN